MTPSGLAAIHGLAMTGSRGWGEAEFESLLADRTVFLVAEPAGFALGRAAAGEAELLTLAVAPEAQRRGMGARLLEAFEAGALQRGAETAFLEVAEDNPAARALYARAGWTQTGRRPRYYARGDAPSADAVLMSKSLV